MTAMKTVIACVWLFALGSFLIGTHTQLAGIGRITFWGLCVAHAIECIVFLPKLKKAPGPLGHHLWQTFLYGFFHVWSLPTAS